MILDGKKVRNEILLECQKEIEEHHLDLTLAIIMIGSIPASEIYVKNKIKYANQIGIKPLLFRLEEDVKNEEVLKLIDKLNNDDRITGIILQSPVPYDIDFSLCSKRIAFQKDVDGFTKENAYALLHNLNGLRPCTVKGIMELLNYYNISVCGEDVCIIGRGDIVGKPLAFEMLNHDASVQICHSKTKNLKEKTLNSGIIVCAAGVKHLLKADMVKNGSIVIDVGISYENGIQYGDCDFENLKDKCSYITPNPGGVGPMTIAIIMKNVIDAYKKGKK